MSRLPEGMEGMERIHQILRRLGLSANYLGFYQMAWAIRLTLEEPERLLLVTKTIYPDVARQFQTNWGAVERNLRTAVRIIWDTGTPLLGEVMGEGCWEKPCTARFLALLTAYLEGQEG